MPLNACSYCSKTVENNEGTKLLRCSRCLRVAYCNKECQTAHWKGEHKQHCGKPNQGGSAPLRNASLPSMRIVDEPEKFGFTDIIVTTPGIDEVNGICALCGTLTLMDGENQMYFVPECIRVDMVTRVNHGVEPYPVNTLKMYAQHEQLDFDLVPYPEPKINYTRRRISAGPGGKPPASIEVSCCRFCAYKFREVMDSGAQVLHNPILEQHLLACAAMLTFYGPKNQHIESILEQGDIFTSLSMVERRMISVVNLYSHPDLIKVSYSMLLCITHHLPISYGLNLPSQLCTLFSHANHQGKGSWAGEYNKQSGMSKKCGKGPFDFVNLEVLAFPDLFPCGTGAWQQDGVISLLHYTNARMNSLSSKWRKHSDYVMFCLHRLVAYGLLPASQLNDIYERRGTGLLGNGTRQELAFVF